MKVVWILPDDSIVDYFVSEIAQFLFLIHFANSVSLKGMTYRAVHIELIIENDEQFISVLLK
jgi:hypothetical protein